ncbi:hypothetical protein Pla22_26820 [Rubripirellula amarantea]|uniref:FG-GAP repeat protein n=1 Tax=Rubripirellula amarantea TaxID=2527999 RepID=A0A5C5WWQ8_9BACT|nr:Ig-like domain-containing protein [Rubripirellula amarantea]TWT55028.1 hypothetical protein Pla22_26820 [Rubripirellula amarantea]
MTGFSNIDFEIAGGTGDDIRDALESDDYELLFHKLGPTAVPDSVVAIQDTAVFVPVLDNDLPSGDVEVIGFSDPANGNATVNANGQIEYTPTSGFLGTDAFDYTIALKSTELTNAEITGGDRYGYSVDVDGDLAVVGAYLDDPNDVTNAGSVSLYRRDGISWQFLTLLTGDAIPQSQFGWSVAVSGDTVVVGAQRDSDNGFHSGAAYVFQDVDGEWTQVRKLAGSDTVNRDLFGRSVDIDRDTIVVGASTADPLGASSGAANVYNRDEGGQDNWGQIKKLTGSTQGAGDRFGQSVAIDNATIVVGAFRNDDQGIDSGAVYVFKRNRFGAENWGELKVITASDASAGDRFGASVAVDGTTVVVGSPQDDTGGVNQLGSVYVLSQNEGGSNNWGQVAKLLATDGNAGDRLGLSVAFDGSRIVAGSPLADGGGDASGRGYLFELTNGSWTQTRVLGSSEVTTADQYGIAVAVDGDVAVIGSWLDNRPSNNSGGAYAFDLQTDTATVTVTVTVNPGSSELPLIEDSPAMMNIASEAALPNVMHENQDADQAVWQARVWARDRVFAQSMETDDENEDERYLDDIADDRLGHAFSASL